MELKEAIKKHGINLRDIARKLDTSESLLRWHLSRGAEMNAEMKEKIRGALKEHALELLRDID